MQTLVLGCQFSFVGYVAAPETEVLRQVHRTLQVCGTVVAFKIERILTPHQRLALGWHIGTCQGSLLAVFVIQTEDIAQLQIGQGSTETAERIAVP